MKNSLKKIGGFFKNVGGFIKKVFTFKSEGKFNLKKIVAFAAVLVLVVVLGVVFAVKNGNSQEKVLSNKLEQLGTDFYENFYYKQIGETKDARAEFLAKFKDIGIKVNLDNLIRHNTEESDELKKEFVNSKTNEACDTNNTKVVIYPKDPYNEKDYKIEVILECGFETESKK